jgi:hypothetical protein
MIGGLVACAHSLWRGGRAGDALQRERDAVAAPVRQTLARRQRVEPGIERRAFQIPDGGAGHAHDECGDTRPRREERTAMGATA